MNKIITAIKNPSLVLSHIQTKKREKENEMHRERIHEYRKYITTPESALKKTFGTVKKSNSNIKLDKEIFPRAFNMDVMQGKFLHSCVKLLKPQLMVETGIANGVSSAYILKAMNENNTGKLISIELRKDLNAGSLVPENLRVRWQIEYGSSLKVMENMFKEHGFIDAFLHDSEHTYGYMLSEYRLAWPHIRDGGLMISDDVGANNAFLEFAESVGRKMVCIQGNEHKSILGIVKK